MYVDTPHLHRSHSLGVGYALYSLFQRIKYEKRRGGERVTSVEKPAVRYLCEMNKVNINRDVLYIPSIRHDDNAALSL